MKVTAKVGRVDTSKASAKAKVAHEKALAATTEAARMDTEPLVPYVTGALRRTAETESKPTKGLLIYGNRSVPYARGQYYNFPNKSWPGTVKQWFEASKSRNAGKWRRITADEYRRHFGG